MSGQSSVSLEKRVDLLASHYTGRVKVLQQMMATRVRLGAVALVMFTLLMYRAYDRENCTKLILALLTVLKDSLQEVDKKF
jgi:hypothetical protein